MTGFMNDGVVLLLVRLLQTQQIDILLFSDCWVCTRWSLVTMADSAQDAEKLIEEILVKFPQGISDKVIIANLPETVDTKTRAEAINKLLVEDKIDLLKGSDGLVYKTKNPSKASSISGDQEEKIVFKIIESSGSLGSWIRDIRAKSNLGQTQLNKVLKSLESRRLIKAVKSVNATKKKVYMLFNLEPDRSVTGGAWYSENDFESEFVEILNQQCYRSTQENLYFSYFIFLPCRFLFHKLETSKDSEGGPLAAKSASMVTVGEVGRFISELGISKVTLKESDIEAILDTIVYDGKGERCESLDGRRLYRAVQPLVPSAGLAACPCGVCPVMRQCGDRGSVTPLTCQYFVDWLEEF